MRLFEYKFIVSSPSEYQNIVNKPSSIHTPSDKILGMMQFNQVQHSIGIGRKSLDQATSKPNLLSPRAHTCCQQCIRRVLHHSAISTWTVHMETERAPVLNVHIANAATPKSIWLLSENRKPQNPSVNLYFPCHIFRLCTAVRSI